MFPPKTRFSFVAAAAVIVLALPGLSFILPDGQPTAAPGGNSAPATQKTDKVIQLEKRVAENPRDFQAWAELGTEYVTVARVASEPGFYPKAEKALARSSELNSGDENWQAVAGKAYLAAGRHDFGKALAFAEQARRIKPLNMLVRGVLVDSLTELGRYPEAVAATQQMVDLKPNFASYSRVSYQRELNGDVPGAIEAFELARQAAGNTEDEAFAVFHLGELEYNRGRIDAAEAHFREVLRLDPQAASALAGLGKVVAAQGDREAAIGWYQKAVDIFPDPELLKELGDLLRVEGRHAAAGRQYARAERANEKQARNGVGVNLEVALASADRKVRLDEGLRAAGEEWARRQSIHVADALGWQLFAHGRFDEALVLADQALRLGTRNAQMYFHRAQILTALGKSEAAAADMETACSINPHALVAGESLMNTGSAPDTCRPDFTPCPAPENSCKGNKSDV